MPLKTTPAESTLRPLRRLPPPRAKHCITTRNDSIENAIVGKNVFLLPRILQGGGEQYAWTLETLAQHVDRPQDRH